MIALIQQRLSSLEARNPLLEGQAIKEVLQQIALYLLWRAGFFEVAAFRGGTSLRMLYQLPRSSEHLDFMLLQPNAAFDWDQYLQPLLVGLTEFGLKSEVLPLIRNDCIGNQLNLRLESNSNAPALKIRLQTDLNPPSGSGFAWTYFHFPLDFEICHQDLPGNFAMHLHALLCNPCPSGRDWYDFCWYRRQQTEPNLPLLQAALAQMGPWQGQLPSIDSQWLAERLMEKIARLDWKAAAADVERLLGVAERESLKLWSARFFLAQAAQLAGLP